MSTERDNLKSPAVPIEVVEWLERIYPDRAPDEGESIFKIRHRSGQVSVVRKLRKEYEMQTRRAMEAST